MRAIDRIKEHMGSDQWALARQAWADSAIIEPQEELSVFKRFKIYIVRGRTGQFDFPSLPRGSYGYYAANSKQAIRLTRRNKEIETVLSLEWESLPHAEAKPLAQLILQFCDDGIKEAHEVLADADALRKRCRSPRGFRLIEDAFKQALPEIGATEMAHEGAALVLRAVTLKGWMHQKNELGIERVRIGRDGSVTMDKRVILAKRIFDSFPAIRY